MTSTMIGTQVSAGEAPQSVGYRIEPRRGRFHLGVRELWDYRELIYFLTWRDLKVRYQQTLLGLSWAIIQPFVTMIVFTVIFNRLGGIQPEYHVPYPLFATAGLLPWFYFTSALGKVTTSITANGGLISKIYFPRLIIPIENAVVPLVDFLASFLLLIAMFLFYGRLPHWHVVAIPFFLGMALFTALGVGLWLAALNVRYRDVGYLVTFVTQIWLFLTPIAYGASAVPQRLRWLISINPLTGVIDGFRWAVLGRGLPQYNVYAVSWSVAIVLTLTGLWYFRRTEREFADII
jgi:lipopolysaccharide transport system permease protein